MRLFFLSILLCLFACEKSDNQSEIALSPIFNESESITGKPEYLDSPFVTAGNRVYMVGHQDGSFPELGWHIKNEMGGIWNHPIKLMDGFEAEIIEDGTLHKIENAKSFTNYPFGNRHVYRLNISQLNIERFQYVPNNAQGLVVQYVVENLSNQPRSFDLKFIGHSDLRPTWLGERTNMEDAMDASKYNSKDRSIIVKDQKNDWFLRFGSIRKASGYKKEKSDYGGKGISRSLVTTVDLAANSSEVLTYIISGSFRSEKELNETYNSIKANIISNLEVKKQNYLDLANKTKLTIPDKDIEQAFRWLKFNCNWLVQEVPGIGTGITAGIPDYPWWFGVDSEYALKGYMRVGQTDAVYSTIKLLDSVSEALNGNGRIIHEMSTNGAVFNEGNINETPQFASLVWDIYQWNGDRNFLETYYPTIRKGLEWLLTERDGNKNGFPDGHGMMEIHGLDSEMIDVAAYTQKALIDASEIAQALGEQDDSKKFRALGEDLTVKINSNFWSDEYNSYADFIASDDETLSLIDDATVRADTLKKPWAVEELLKTKQQILNSPSSFDRPFVVHHNWVVNTPMEMNIADSSKALRALNTAEKFVNPFGVFVTGIDRDESAGSDDGSFKGSEIFSYTGAVMTLPTAVQIISENNYGRPDQALNYLKRMTRSFSYALPGSMYEVSPDYGMMTQAWNIYGYAVPIVSQFFGINPKASQKTVVISPQMPSSWDEASLENVQIADNEISVYYNRNEDKLHLKVVQLEDFNWKLLVQLPKGLDYETFDEVKVTDLNNKTQFETTLNETEIIVHFK